ncbi:MAG: AraC family transcriptional regulator [Alloprevotella sp.]|nr:AraC family transcriptional regulator [Alloprevotella sp.]
MIRQLSLDDVRPYASPRIPDTDRDLLFLEDFSGVDFTDKTLQLGFMLVCYCSAGTATAIHNERHVELHPGDVLLGFGQQVFEQCRPSKDFRGRIALISQECCLESFVGMQHLWPFLYYLLEHPVFSLDAEERDWLFHSFDTVIRRLRHRTHHYHREAVVSQLRVFYFDICNFLAERNLEAFTSPSRAYNIFGDFMELARHNFRQHRDVQWYSEQLCISPKYLSEAVKRVSGKTAGQWITTLVLTEMKFLLRNTGYSIKEVAQRMNFPNQSFFGKFFKSATGLSPTAYRTGE